MNTTTSTATINTYSYVHPADYGVSFIETSGRPAEVLPFLATTLKGYGYDPREFHLYLNGRMHRPATR